MTGIGMLSVGTGNAGRLVRRKTSSLAVHLASSMARDTVFWSAFRRVAR